MILSVLSIITPLIRDINKSFVISHVIFVQVL